MRRKDKEIADRLEVEELLTNALVGRLGTCLDNVPYITPVNFAYDNDKIYFHSAHEGRKIENIKYNQHVCFEIDEMISIIPGRRMPCGSTTEYKSVIIFGMIRVVADIDEKTFALNKLIEKYAHDSPRLPQSSDAAKRTNVLVIEVKEITAKQSPIGKKVVITPTSTNI
ncbi:MAG: pyridoxamine 5'-phosphate oxidase family protein [Candidatus Scalindua sp. AMX11]|nr:MAG: pyridoxamine 5'-phosphate oxidase family protein [Candidatus Scalindua sp.]NOG85667.1 pyridoxamine 5'-phosphate oxidase family protein [Planctomycetota bacterium]RZV82440.1 MAG: pyridoxamine 5'-phosphate oxidase family protein [Candidatus Scalindua sp. SCAELEC01]TDE65638.1 MAG: pyridoxamine 5'-phosphate oxidase family protein [Candidatus Scalindua sp. AMX11]GJQ59164.1 MAG: pyridoxamine 5'-phosphate oxidase [Candidatus Scalindua sp.]